MVKPPHPGLRVDVTLLRKSGGVFEEKASKSPKMTANGGFTASFNRPKPGACKVIATFAGDRDHDLVTGSKVFDC